MQTSLGDATLLVAIIVLLKAWETRNKEVHGEKGLNPTDLISWSISFLESYQQAPLSAGFVARIIHPNSWNPPPVGTIKINFDAAFPHGADHYSIAIVARDWTGQCLSTTQHLGQLKAVEGEARAAVYALSTTRLKGWDPIIVEGDCLRVINVLKQGESPSTTFGAYLEDCFSIAKTFRNCSFSFVKRSGNVSLAHSLASLAESSCNEGTDLPAEFGEYA